MKTLKFTLLILAVVIGFSLAGNGIAQSANWDVNGWDDAWIPNDGDLNFIHLDFVSGKETAFFLTNKAKDDFLEIKLGIGKAATVYYDFDSNVFTYELNTLQVESDDKFWLGYFDNNTRIYQYDFNVLDPGKVYNLNFDGTTITIVDAAPIPLPASAWLLGAALVGLIGFRRRFSNLYGEN